MKSLNSLDTNHELLEDLRSWDSLSIHRTGSEGDLQTSQRLVERLRSYPTLPEIVQYAMVRRIPTNCYVEGASFKIDGIPLLDCIPTVNNGVQGTLAAIGESGEFGVGSLFATGADTDSRKLLSSRSNTLYKGLIGISRNETPGISIVNADQFVSPFGLPVLMIDGFEADPLTNALSQRERVTLCVEFEEQNALATNVEFSVQGRNPDLAPVVVMTPKSSWWTSTAERIGGIAAWLGAARHTSLHQPLRTVIFTANSGHELGHTGLHSFLRRHPSLATGAHIWVHLGANLGAEDSQLRVQVSEEHLSGLASQVITEQGLDIAAYVPSDRRPGGESRDIFDAGGRYVSLLGSNRLFHHPDDRLENNVDIEKVTNIQRAVIQLVSTLAN